MVIAQQNESTGRAAGVAPLSVVDTIVAIATPLGESGVGVIRLSGPAAISLAKKIFSNPALAAASTHTLHHGWIMDDQSRIDEAVVSLFRAPRSYTGEDVVEISCHGSPAVLKDIVTLCERRGARLARPGEFTERAYLNGKMDLLQAEAVATLISARSSAARAAAAAQLEGTLSMRVKELRARLLDVAAHVEANLDFVEEDIPGLSREKMKQDLGALQSDMDALLATSVRGRFLREGLRVALVGRPNVGKSSLFNALLAQERAIVSAVPGTTRDTLEESLQWDGIPVVLTDTAGLRPAKGKLEKMGTDRARKVLDNADVVVFVADASVKWGAADAAALKNLKNKRAVAAKNKSDRKKALKDDLSNKFPFKAVVATSALKGTGLLELKDAVLFAMAAETRDVGNTPVITNLRHARHLEKARDHVRAALTGVGAKKSEEAVAVDLRAALAELGALTGEAAGDDVLASIFRQFCIGK